jgi:tetratricopeptide (TPR) repeat protein
MRKTMSGLAIGGAPSGRAYRSIRAAGLATLFLASAACASPEQKFAKYMKSGEEYLEQGKLGLANVQFQNALKLKEDNVPALRGLATIAEKRSNYEQMFGILQRISRLDPANLDVKLDLAKLYLLAEETATSLDLVNTVVDAEPENAEALAVKAAIMFRLQNNSEAVDLANKALAINPASQEAVAVLASERVASKDLDGAIAILDAALARDSKAAVLHILRVQALTNLGRTQDVNAAYKRLIGEFPDDANYRRLYATTLIEQNRLEDARAELVEVARILPREREAKLDVIRIDYRIGGKAKAEGTFRTFIAADDDDIDLKLAFGAFLREEKDFLGADAVYHEIIKRKGVEIAEILRTKNEMAALNLLWGKRPQAEKIISEILAADGGDPEALVKRAGLKLADGNLDEAINDLRIVVGEHPDSVPARLLMASAFEQKEDFAFAESEYAQAVQASKQSPQASNLFAKFLVRRGQVERAERVLAESVAVNPASEENLKMLAAIRLDRQDWRGAEEAANTLRSVDSSDEDVSRILGAAYSGLKDYAGAIEVLTTEHARAPLASQPLATLIQAYVNAGRNADAEKFLKDTISRNPNFYEAHVLLAQLERVEGRSSDAIATLQKAIAMDPLRPEAHEALYGVNVREGRREEAGRVIEQALSAIPDNDGLQVLKADHLIATGDNDAAIAIYETILARRPGDLIVANNLASLLSDRPDAASIARAVEAASQLKDSDNPYFLDTYGWALYRGGRTAEGIAALEKSAKAVPTLADVRYHLGVALIETGDVARGRAELEAAIAAPGADPALAAEARRRLGITK